MSIFRRRGSSILGAADAGASYTTLHDTLSATATDTTSISTTLIRNGTTFTAPEAGITSMRWSMRLWSSNAPAGLVYAQIWSTSAGVPIAQLAQSDGQDLSGLPGSKPADTNVTFEVSLALTNATRYAIVYHVPTLTTGETIVMQRIGDTYANGNHVAQLSGGSWLNVTGSDLELLLEYS